ncbi:MAG: glycosyltransferase family 4 protein [bacterium]
MTPNRIKVFHSYPRWELSGVATWSTNLISALDKSRFDQRILLTSVRNLAQKDILPPRELPTVLLHPEREKSYACGWYTLTAFLTAQAPCIYLPLFDFHSACAVGLLPSNVAVCAGIRSDEEIYYENAERLGIYFDATVAASQFLADECARRVPTLADRIYYIPNGIAVTADATPRFRTPNSPLRLLYANRLVQYQKRVFDLPKIASALRAMEVPFHLTIAGEGEDGMQLQERFAASDLTEYVTFLGRVSRSEVLKLCRSSDVFLLTSDFEGMPNSLLEAMSTGCVPVAYRIRSGLEEIVTDLENGLLVSPGDCKAFAEALRELYFNLVLFNALSVAALNRIRSRFSLRQMGDGYGQLFMQLAEKVGRGDCSKRDGKVRKSPQIRLANRLIFRVRRMFSHPT